MVVRSPVQELTPVETEVLVAKLDSMLPELSAKEEKIVRRALIREGLPIASQEPDEDSSWWAGDVGY